MTKKFRLVFLATVILTGACGLGMGVIALVPNQSPQLVALFDVLLPQFPFMVFLCLLGGGIERRQSVRKPGLRFKMLVLIG